MEATQVPTTPTTPMASQTTTLLRTHLVGLNLDQQLLVNRLFELHESRELVYQSRTKLI